MADCSATQGKEELVEEILISIGCKVGLCTCLTAEGFTRTDELKVVKTAGNALIAVAVESIEIDACTTINTGVHLGTSQYGITVCINNAGSSCGVCVDEICVCIGWVIRAFDIAVTERVLNGCERRYRTAVAFELCLSFLVCCLDSSLDFCDSLGIGLGIIKDTLYLGVPPLMLLGSHTLA